MEQNTPFADPKTALNFILAGNARVTLKSLASGLRYTYRVEEKEEPEQDNRKAFFVQLLKGRDNSKDYVYIGMIRAGKFFATKASRHFSEAAFFKAFEYVLKHLVAGHMPPKAEIWHESKCGKCGRPLTVPSSIASGLGPECARHVRR